MCVCVCVCVCVCTCSSFISVFSKVQKSKIIYNFQALLFRITITIGSPIPVTGFEFGGQLEFGNNCLYDADFANSVTFLF